MNHPSVGRHRGLRSALAQVPPDAARALRRYLSPVAPGSRRGARRPERHYWALAPRWLAGRSASPRLLRDALWGQRALFLFVRIHDDLYDGQTAAPALVYAADLLLVESARAFARHAAGGFWRIFGDALDTTLAAVLEVDALQRRPAGMPVGSHRAYARVGAIFKVGTAAVLEATGRAGRFPAFSRFADEVAIADQLVDDLVDLDEDLARGRLNYVASTLLGGADGRRPRAADPRARLALAIEDGGLAPIARLARQHLARARRAAVPLGLAEIDAWLAPLEARLDDLADEASRARARTRLGPLVAGSVTARRPSSRAPARAR